jgi:hypothetical protein
MNELGLNGEKVACGVDGGRRRGERCVVVETVAPPQLVAAIACGPSRSMDFFPRDTEVWI